MDNKTLIIIGTIGLLTGLTLFILMGFYNKINIRDIYKKLLILGLFLFNILGISTVLILNNIDVIQNNISNGNYEIFLLLIPIISLLGFIIFYLIRLSLGRIDIKIFGENFNSGDKLTGEINLKLKKDIKNASLYIYLRGYQYIKSNNSGRNSGGSRKKKYEDRLILKKDTFFESNYAKNYNFSFNIPYINKEGENAINILEKKYDTDLLNNEQKKKVIKMAKNILQFTGVDSGKEYLKLWKIEVRLKKDGIDLFNQKKVNVVRQLKD